MEEKDYFDKIAEDGLHRSAVRSGQNGSTHQSLNELQGRNSNSPPPYDSIVSRSIENDYSDGGDEDEDELTELGASGLPKTVLRFVNPSASPTRRESKVPEIESPEDEDEDDEYLGSSLKRNRRKCDTNSRKTQTLDDFNVPRHGNVGKANVTNSTVAKGSPLSTFFRQTVTKVSNHIPVAFRRKSLGDYQIEIFVAFMFFTIVLMVGSIYVIHEERELQKAYFDRIRFAAKDRRIRVSNLKGREVLSGVLGTTLSPKDRAWECLVENRRTPTGTCLEWMNIARLHFRITNPRKDWDPLQHNMQCYEILWESLNSNFQPKDCYYIGDTKGFHFYGGGEVNSNPWPLQRTSIPTTPFITGKKIHNGTEFQFGQTLRSYFVGSPGVSIEISRSTPFHFSIDDSGGKAMMCFTAKSNSFAYPDHSPPNILNYTLCTGETVKDVFTQLADKEIWNGLRDFHEDVHAAEALISSPTWKLVPEMLPGRILNEATLLNKTDQITELELSDGFLLLDETWQRTLGDLEFDPERFPNMGETVNITRRRGFKIALTIQPYFALTSVNYARGHEKGIWVKQFISDLTGTGPPAVTTFKGQTVVMLDITRKGARAWIHRKLSDVLRKFNIDALYIDFGSIQDFPRYFDFAEPIFTPDEYKEIFMKSIRNLNRAYAIGTTSATKLPKLPTFVTLTPTASTWAGLQSIIPSMLSVGVAGFPFVTPGVIGGDFVVPQPVASSNLQPEIARVEEAVLDGSNSSPSAELEKSNDTVPVAGRNSEISSRTDFFPGNTPRMLKPDRDLYLRWLQLVHFLPVVQYTFLPSQYDSEMVELAQKFKSDRKTKLYPFIKKALHEALTTGFPIVRPLWMSDPGDLNCLKIWDEYTIGGVILVAPILQPNTTERDIYLPKGRWRDEMDGSSTKGERWIHNYRLKFSEIAFFTKLDDPAMSI